MTEENWQPRSGSNGARMLLGLLLLLAMAFSGHAAAAQARGGISSFAVAGDWLHLLSTSLWVGGIIFIAITLMPAIWSHESADRARGLVKLLPRFSVIALVSVTVAALSGSFNADVQLTSWNQFIDTTYGRTLIVKILLVMVMILISAYHAFRIRPALARALRTWDRLEGAALPVAASTEANGRANGTRAGQSEQPTAQSLSVSRTQAAHQEAAGQSGSTGTLPRKTIPLQPFTLPTIPALKALGPDDETLDDGFLNDEEEAALQEPQTNEDQRRAQKAARVQARVERLSEQLRVWIRREALLGTGVLLCASLLGGLAGSLAPTPPGAPNVNAPTLTSTTKSPVDMTSTVGTLKVTLQVAPDKFGTNSVGVLIIDTKTGKPVDGANVHLVITMVEMDMGTGTSDLTGSGNGSGFYTGQIDLLMGGHWTVQVQIRTPQDPNTIQRVSFTFPVTF